MQSETGTKAEMGHELRRPEADYLRDDIYELRVGMRGQNYRMLYFFHGRYVVVLSHGLTKEAAVPASEINLAIKRRKNYLAHPARHIALIASEEQEHEDDEEQSAQDE